MKRLMVFPFTYSNREVLMYRKYMKDYKVTTAVTWNQSDVQFFLGKFEEVSDVFITEEYEKALAMCDAVLFMESSNMDVYSKTYENYIQKALENRKEVYVTQKCQKFLNARNKKKCVGINDDFAAISQNIYIKNIDVPAIGVMGLGEFCNKYCCEMEIALFFRKMGYSVIHFGSKDFAGMYEERRYPEFIYKREYSITKRILEWNQYLFDVCDREKPDLVILGMPGGIMPLNNKILNDFGEIPYIISNGIRIDTGVLCSYFYERVEQRYLTEYKNFCKYKLNCEVEWICVSNSSCRFDPDSEESILEYLHYNSEIADKMVIDAENKEKIRFCNILNNKSRDNMLNQLYEGLTESVSAF